MTTGQPKTSLPTRTQGQPAARPTTESKAAPVKRKTGGIWPRLARYRWIAALASLGCALWAQKLAEDSRLASNGLGTPPTLSWALFALAAVLFVIAVPATSPPPTGQPTLFMTNLRAMSRPRRTLFLGLLGAGISCDVVAVPLFLALHNAEPDTVPGWPVNTGSWLLYMAGLLLFAGAWVVWERSVPAATTAAETQGILAVEATQAGRRSIWRVPPSRVEWIVMAALTLLALALRLPGLDSAPPGLWFDEAQNGIVARNLLAPNALHPAFIGDFTQMGGLYFYMLGLVLKVFGDTAILPLRLLPAIAGTLIVPMLYMIGSRLYGWRVGLVAGTLLAVSAWNITFSRLGMASMPTVVLNIAVYLCLLQGLRTGRLGYYAGAGVLMGLAFQMYYASQLVPVVLGLVFLYWLITVRMRFWRAIRGGIVVLAAGILIGFLPVATFLTQHLNVYMARTGTVSIFTPEGSDGHPDALGISLTKHALMFNYMGDSNGRHNLPGAPMLDFWTGALFLVGLGVCLLRVRRWHYFFPLIWFLVSMSGGVLTVVFEAPQGHRTLEASVITALIAGIYLGETWKALTTAVEGRRATDHRRPVGLLSLSGGRARLWVTGAVALGVLAVLVVTAVTNVNRYFNQQMNNQSVWLDMLGPDREIGRLVAQYNDTHKVYISSIKADYPPGHYLVPNANIASWPGMYTFPLTEARDTEIVLTQSDGYDVAAIRRIYKNAVVKAISGPDHGAPQVYSVTIPAQDIIEAHGVHATLFPTDSGKALVEQTLERMAFDAASGAGSAGQIARIRLSATLKVDTYAAYSFGLAGDAGAEAAPAGTIMVDGFDVSAGTPITLGTGLHSVAMTGTLASSGGQAGKIELMWASGQGTEKQPINSVLLFDPRKIEPRGLTGLFRQGASFDTEPTQGRVDPTISFYFHITPLVRPYTADWQGKLYAPVDGQYTFQTEQISHSRLYIDGQQLIVNDANNNAVSAQTNLSKGLHDIRLQYEDYESFSHVYLFWTPPGLGDRFIIPSAFLLPVMGSYPDHPESGDWPGIEAADDTDWTRASDQGSGAGSQGSGSQGTQGAQATQVAVQPTPTLQQVEKPTAIPAGVGQTTPKEIKPVLVLGQDGETLARPKAGAVDEAGNIYIYTETDTSIHKFSADGKPENKWVV
jgi:4-amino-4-deoxy-L-arabinose transferase-like glycosyltransferase